MKSSTGRKKKGAPSTKALRNRKVRGTSAGHPSGSKVAKSSGRGLASKPSKVKPAASGSAADPLDDFITGAARALGLVLDPDWLPAVRANLEVIFAQAALVGEFALPDSAEPAPVFTA